MGTVKGKFMVKDEDYPEFLDLLHDYLWVQQRRPLNLVEQRRHDLFSPILIDLDFKYAPERAITRYFSMNHIHTFVRHYVDNLKHYYDLSDSRPLRFFISLRPNAYEDKKNSTVNRSIKDGVHIQCPDIILNSEHQQVLRMRSIELNHVNDAFNGTGYINHEKDIFDEAIVKKNGWFFYGESKPDIIRYELKSVYVYDPSTNDFYEEDVEDFTPRQLIELLSIRYNLQNNELQLKHDNEEIKEEWNKYLDICTGKLVIQDKNTVIESAIQINTTTSNVHEQLEQEKLTIAKQLALECLSAERADSYQSWIEVGWCLHNIDPSEDMFNTWIQFSEKSGKSSDNNINNLYRDWTKGWNKGYRERQFTIRSLHMWAKIDNPKRYRQIMNNSFIDFVEREVDATHTHIARLMKRMYGNNYCAAVDSKKTEWYEFTGSYWKKLPQGIELRNKMTTEVAQIICETRAKIRNRAIENGELNDQRFIETRMKQMMNIEKCLYTAGFKDSVMKECQGLFYEDDFSQKLNSNQYLIGFANGVLDLHAVRDKADGSGKEYYVNFRKAEPTDYITFMAGRWQPRDCDPIDYVEYDPNDPEQIPIHMEIDDFMEKVFPNPDVRNYVWIKLASCIEGDNKEQTYDTWIGVGGNAKTVLVDLVTMTLGDYATSLQATAMTRKRPESGAANPDIMAVRNKRFIFMSEPDDREPLNTSRMKQFTGCDPVEARGLFEDQTKFVITGKLFMLCNAFPAINTMDTGTWRRIRVVPFESRFVPSEQLHLYKNEKNVYPRDPTLPSKLKKWRTLFMSRLVHIYKTQYLHKGLGKEPDIILQESNKYRESFDSLARFMNAHVIEEPGFESTIREIYNEYVNWYTSIGGGVGRKLSQNDLYKRLSDKFGEPADKKTFKRFHLFGADEDIEEYKKHMAK
jgi:P4 family phage/plasmid primase-like protien